MGLFFESQSIATASVPAMVDSLHFALMTDPTRLNDAHRVAAQMAIEARDGIQLQTKQFRWARFVGAIVFLAAIFIAGVYCAHDDKLQEWSSVLLHAFEVLLGGVVGLVAGEGAGQA